MSPPIEKIKETSSLFPIVNFKLQLQKRNIIMTFDIEICFGIVIFLFEIIILSHIQMSCQMYFYLVFMTKTFKCQKLF